MVGSGNPTTGIVGNPGQPDRLGIVDQPLVRRVFAHRLPGLFLVQSPMQELFQQAISADDTQRGVPGVRDISRAVDDAVQHTGRDSSCTIQRLAVRRRRSRS